MVEGKYAKNFFKAPIEPSPYGPAMPMMRFKGEVAGVDMTWVVVPVLEAHVMVDKPHKHENHQFLCFLGGDMNNIEKYDAEVELYLGEEQEKYIINTPTIVHITPGLIHCPTIYKRVDSPVIHLDIFFAGKYAKTIIEK